MQKYSFMSNKHRDRAMLWIKNNELDWKDKESWIAALKYFRDVSLPVALYIKELIDKKYGTREKEKEDQLRRYSIHFRNRVNQRFHANLSEGDVQDIKDGCKNKKYKFLKGAKRGRELYLVEIYGLRLEVVYDQNLQAVITAYPYRSWNQGLI